MASKFLACLSRHHMASLPLKLTAVSPLGIPEALPVLRTAAMGLRRRLPALSLPRCADQLARVLMVPLVLRQGRCRLVESLLALPPLQLPAGVLSTTK